MEKDERQSGGPAPVAGNREPQRASDPAPGKVTRTSRLSPGRGPSVQRKAVVPAPGAGGPPARSAWDVTMDPWMDAAHRGVTALAERGQDAGPMQAKGDAGTPALPAQLPGPGGGAEMPGDVRGKMEAAFGADFAPVRIHEGPHAKAIGAQAYTQGTDIHFAPGQYQPDSQRGQELLGHELTHVVQQAEGRVRTMVHAKGAPLNDDPALEQEADVLGARAARGERVASGQRAGHVPRATSGPGQAKSTDPASNESPAGQEAPIGLDMAQAVQDPAGESLALPEGTQAPVQARAEAAPVQAKGRPAPIQANALQPIQRQEGGRQSKVYVPYRIPITRPMTGEEFKVAAARQVFGAVIEATTWKNIKDSYSPENSPVTLHVEVGLLNRYRGQVNQARGFEMDPGGGISGAGERARSFQSAPASDEKTALMAEIDRRYAAAAGVPQGTAIEPGQAGQAELWRTIRDEVLFQREHIARLPPKVKELIRFGTKGKTLTPADYDQLFRIAKKIEGMPPGQVADYLGKINGATTDPSELEASLDRYAAEMAQRALQAEEREGIQTKLDGLKEVYEKYRQYMRTLTVEAVGAGMGAGLGPRASTSMQEELTRQLQAHGFASVSEFEAYIEKFEKAFEQGAATMVIDLLARYEGTLYREAQRFKDPMEVSALYQKLGGVRMHHAAFEQNAAISNDHARNAERSRLPGNGHLRPKATQDQAGEAHQRAEASRQAAQAEIQGLSAAHPIFQEEGLPLDRRIDKAALAKAGEGQLGGLIAGHIAGRIKDIQEARSQVQGKSELIYKMDKMMPQFYAQQGIAPGSIHDAIIQDKLRDDAVVKLVGGISLAIVGVALTVVSLGAATPAIVAAGAAAGAFGLSGYMVYEEYEQYAEQQDLADVGLADDPSIVWLVLAVAGAAVDMGAAVKAVRALAPAAKALNAGGDASAFTKAVQALQKAGEIDARIAQAAEKAAAARQGFAQASGDLVKVLGGKAYSFPGPFTDPEVFRILVQMAKAKIQEGVSSFQIFAGELQKARTLAKLGELSPEELAKAKQAWEQALRQVKEGSEAVAKGVEREKRVAELVGGRVSREPVKTRFGSSDIDVVGPDGELIMVGGPAKARDLSKLGTQLKVLQEAARDRGVAAKAAFEKGTPQEVIDLAMKKLGPDHVMIFDP